MKNFKRALRRCNKERMKRKAMRAMVHYDEAFKLADHMASCSCYSCCNPRHSGYNKIKITIPEYLHELSLYDQISELDNVFYKIKNRKKNKKVIY